MRERISTHRSFWLSRALVATVGCLPLVACGAADTGSADASSDSVSSVNQALCSVAPLTGTATASSVETASFPASAAVDGNASTRWSSTFSDPQWLRIDLGQVRYIDNAVLTWEAASAADYSLQLSSDGTNWTTVKTITAAAAGARTDTLTGLSGHVARYVRMYGTRRTTAWGYSLYEFKLNGSADPNCASTARDITSNLEAESTDGMSGVQFETTTDIGGGQNGGWIDPGDYLEWRINVPTAGNYTVTSRSATWAAAGQQIVVDGVQQTSLALPSTWTGTGNQYQTWASFTSSAIALSAGTHTLRLAFSTGNQNVNWVKVAPAQADEFETGLWRAASRTDRLTLTRDSNSGLLSGASYSGNVKQQFRLHSLGNARYEFKLESTKECLVPSGGSAILAACGNAANYFTVETLRSHSETQPALYNLHAPNGTCLNSNGTAGPTLGSCAAAGSWYLEPVGYGERSKPSEYELHMLMVVKPITNVATPSTHATIAQDIIDAAQISFKRDVATWYQRMTDGRITWVGDSVVSPDPITVLTEEGGNWLPTPEDVPTDVQRYLVRGKYDSTTMFFLSRDVPGGWGWGPGISPASNYTMWVTVNGGDTPAADWISGNNEPTEVFIHEPMHGLDGFFGNFGVPLPDGLLHGAEINLYANEQNGWAPWYRDYLLGTVIASDDTYRGYGPRAFRFGTPRADALKH